MGLTRLKDRRDSDPSASASARRSSACPSKPPSAAGSFVGSSGLLSSGLGLSSISAQAQPVPMPPPAANQVKKTDTLDSVLSQTESEMSSSSSGVSAADGPSSTPPSSIGSLTGVLEKMMVGADGRRAKEQSKGSAVVKREGNGIMQGKSVLGMQRVKEEAKTMEKQLEEARCTCMFEMDTEEEEKEREIEDVGFASHDDVTDGNDVDKSQLLQSHLIKRRVPRPPSGPSLLSQTAPTDVHNHRSQCSTHTHHQSRSKAQPNSSSSPSTTSSFLLSVPSAVAAGAASVDLTALLTSSPQCASVPDLCRSPSPASSHNTTTDSSPTPSASSLPAPISIKIADLGNATPIHKHYTEDIQTRQYRSPEAITGRSDWGTTADVWSLACVVFELLTAEYLFDPQSQRELFGKDDDHCAQIMELLGSWPENVLWGGRYSRDIFDSNGESLFFFFCGSVCFGWVLWGHRGLFVLSSFPTFPLVATSG